MLLIMFVGSLVLWIGTPLLSLWAGSQVEGLTGSVGAAFAVGLAGMSITVLIVAATLARLSNAYRANRRSRGLRDPGHAVLERVLALSAALRSP